MTVAAKKREWFLARRSELHARGLKDTHIAEQMGLKRSYFSQVVKDMTPGDAFIDRMCSAFGFTFDIGSEITKPGEVDPVLLGLRSEVDQLRHSVNTQTTLLTTLTNLIQEKLLK